MGAYSTGKANLKKKLFNFKKDTKKASPSLLVVVVIFRKIDGCYNGLFHFILKCHMHAIYRLSYIKLN